METQKSQCSCFSPNAICCRTRKGKCHRWCSKAVCWRFLSGLVSGEGSSCNFLWFRGAEKGSPSTDWMRPTHIGKGSLLYAKSSDLNLNHIIWVFLTGALTSGHQNPAKLTHKINYHSGCLMLPDLLLRQPHELVISNSIFHRVGKHPKSCTAGKQQRQESKSFWHQILVVSNLPVFI